MPKNVPNVQDVLNTTKSILASKNGRILYTEYRAELDKALPNNAQALHQIVKRRMLNMVVEGVDTDMQPLLYVVAELPKG